MTMTKEEAKKMEGTEFTYIFGNGDSIPAYVKKVDVETGKMSCWSFSLTANGGHVFEPTNSDEVKEGACCVLIDDNWRDTLRKLTKIRDTKKWSPSKEDFAYGPFTGCPF